MKTVRIISVFVMIWAGITSASAATFLSDLAEWPFISPTVFLSNGPNAVTAGTDLLFWSLGDTITVIDKTTFGISATFRVETCTTVQDMLYDESEHILYVAAGFDEKAQSGGLQIFDLSVPTAPVLTVIFDESPDNPGIYKKSDTESLTTPHIDARGLGLNNGIIYLADDNYGLRIIDVTTDPAHPSEVHLTTPIMGSEDTALDDRTSGYKQPDINGEFKATGGYINLSLYSYDDKIYAFVLDFYNGVKVFDVTDPGLIEDPYYKDTRSFFWYGGVSLLSDIFVTTTAGRLTAFVTGEYFDDEGSIYALTRLDVTFAEDKPLVNLGIYDELTNARSVCVSGDYAYVADSTSGLAVVDIVHGVTHSDPDITVLFYPKVGTYSTQGDLAYSVFLEGATLYLATGDLGLNRLNVSNPASPVLNDEDNNWAPSITGDDVSVSGNYTYMMDRDKGLRIFDSTEPSNPLLRSFFAYEGPSTDLAVSGNYVYIADSRDYISIVNVTDPLAPVLTAASIASDNPTKLFISGNVLYITDGTGLKLVDITDPLHPAVLGSYAALTAVSVYVHESRAYVARGDSGVDIVDVSDAESPVLIVNVPMDNAMDVSVLANAGSVYALVAVGEDGLKIQNVTDLENLPAPVEVINMDTDTLTPSRFTASTVAVLGNNAYVGLGSDGILALNLENPLLPAEIDHKTTISESGDIVAYLIKTTHYLTVAEKNTGFRVLYLYSSAIIDPAKPLVPSIDAGCFIGAASDKSSVTGRDKGWTHSILNVLGRLFPFCRHNETDSGSYLNWRA